MKLDEPERLLIMAAHMHGRAPDEPEERIRANCGKVIAQALVWAGLWTEQLRPHFQDRMDLTIAEWYSTLIAMTQVPVEELLLEGWGNLGSPVGDPPAAPTFTACRLTNKGWDLAKQLLAENPDYCSKPKEFFRGL